MISDFVSIGLIETCLLSNRWKTCWFTTALVGSLHNGEKTTSKHTLQFVFEIKKYFVEVSRKRYKRNCPFSAPSLLLARKF